MPNNSSQIARTLKGAQKLGHRTAKITKAEAEALKGSGVDFSPVGGREGSICFIGLCDAGTGKRLVGYYDGNGNCNIFVKYSC
ncbi:MAG: hypothetical protein AB7F09_10905 [Parvibaculaceae bacterium]